MVATPAFCETGQNSFTFALKTGQESMIYIYKTGQAERTTIAKTGQFLYDGDRTELILNTT